MSLIRERLSAVAGILYSSAGFFLLMGIITAETKYPIFRHYTTRQEISDLGGTRPPQGLVTQPSAMIFDTIMLFGAGAFLVGVYPGNTTPHPFVALIAFVFAPLTAIVVFRVTSGPFRFISLSMGLLSLVALIAGEMGDNSFFVKSIGIGGTERWQVYPIALWLAVYGGYLLASGHSMQSDRHSPAAADGQEARGLAHMR
jgi:hypothetical membrane protein